MNPKRVLESDRLEAFSDGVIAVIITIMVLELKVPHGFELTALAPLVPTLATYVVSFVYVAIYWNNHHHLLRAAEGIDGRSMWANMHLLFWLSLIPFVTSWVGQDRAAPIPTAVYGLVLLCCGWAYTMLQRALIACNGPDSVVARAVGHNPKALISLTSYIVAIAAAFVTTWISDALYVSAAVLWVIPDRRIERVLTGEE